MKNELKFRADIEVQQGQNCIKSKVWDQFAFKINQKKMD
jgi:hypothetical protein